MLFVVVPIGPSTNRSRGRMSSSRYSLHSTRITMKTRWIIPSVSHSIHHVVPNLTTGRRSPAHQRVISLLFGRNFSQKQKFLLLCWNSLFTERVRKRDRASASYSFWNWTVDLLAFYNQHSSSHPIHFVRFCKISVAVVAAEVVSSVHENRNGIWWLHGGVWFPDTLLCTTSILRFVAFHVLDNHLERTSCEHGCETASV